MEGKWHISSLGETCYITDGAHAKVERQSSGVLYLTSKNIGVGSLSLEKIDYISEADFQRLFTDTKKSQRRLRNGDVLTGIIGTFGNAYRYKKDDHFGISSSVAIFRPDQDILDSDFLYYVITSEPFKATVEAYKGGSVQGYTNIATLKMLPIPLPDLRSQKRISKILRGLDDKIELNRQMNATLESMAQALFKSWFVDFDPVIDNALAAGNPIPEPLHKRAEVRAALGDQRKLLPAAIQQQFPSRFVFSEEMGWIPEGWEIGSLAGLCEKITDGSHQSPKSVELDVGLPMASAKDLTDRGVDFSTCRYISKEDFSILVNNGCSPNVGDVLIAKDGSRCGETCCIHGNDNPVVLLSSVAILRPKSPEYSTYINVLLSRSEAVANLRENYVSGSAIPRIVLRDFKRYPALHPPEIIFKHWNIITKSYHGRVVNLDTELKSLAVVRDTLLPKLLSGELRIPEAEKLLEQAL